MFNSGLDDATKHPEVTQQNEHFGHPFRKQEYMYRNFSFILILCPRMFYSSVA